MVVLVSSSFKWGVFPLNPVDAVVADVQPLPIRQVEPIKGAQVSGIVPLSIESQFPFVAENVLVSDLNPNKDVQFVRLNQSYSLLIWILRKGFRPWFLVCEDSHSAFKYAIFRGYSARDSHPSPPIRFRRNFPRIANCGETGIRRNVDMGCAVKGDRKRQFVSVVGIGVANQIGRAKFNPQSTPLPILHQLNLSHRGICAGLGDGNGPAQNLGLVLHVPGLFFHPFGLGVNVAASLAYQDSLPNHASNLKRTDYHQTECEPCEPILYLEVLASLLAGLIAAWGGWLWGGGRRVWGGLVIGLSLWLFLSFFTGFLFNDPLFWRPIGRILTGGNPYRCQGDQQTEYRQPFQHNSAIVPQKYIDSL